MNYLIKWQFTKENPSPFRTQIEIIQSNLIPLVRSDSFKRNINFYITKINFTNVRLAVFVKKENLKILQDTVNSFSKPLILNPNDGWDGSPAEEGNVGSSTYYESVSMEQSFRKYLEKNTKIGFDLHQLTNFDLAKFFAVDVMYKMPPLGKLTYGVAQEILGKHLHNFSEYYRLLEKNNNELQEFWDSFSYYFDNNYSATPWRHFYYNIVLGIEPKIVLNNGVPNWIITKEDFLKELTRATEN